MKLGDTLNGYQIITQPTNVGGGMSQWAFARKGDRDYFVKMFLAPKYPLPHAPGSPAAKARKLEVCMAFEQRHLEIARRLDPTAPGAGNLVVPVDFFRVDATYVKVMERVAAGPLPEAHTLTGHQILVILRTLVFSLRLLHDQKIVHGDIKPDNVLVQQTDHGLYISKLIDFDEAYIAGKPPPAAQIVGDPSYYAPELLRYIKADSEVLPEALSTAADMFSLGLLLHQFMVGDHPDFDRTWAVYPCEAVASGEILDISKAPEAIRSLLGELLAADPATRPDIALVVDFLRDVDGDLLVPTGPPATRPKAHRIRTPQDARPPIPTLHSTMGKGASATAPTSTFPGAPAIPGAPAKSEDMDSGPAPVKGPGGIPLRSTMGRRRATEPADPKKEEPE